MHRVHKGIKVPKDRPALKDLKVPPEHKVLKVLALQLSLLQLIIEYLLQMDRLMLLLLRGILLSTDQP